MTEFTRLDGFDYSGRSLVLHIVSTKSYLFTVDDVISFERDVFDLKPPIADKDAPPTSRRWQVRELMIEPLGIDGHGGYRHTLRCIVPID